MASVGLETRWYQWSYEHIGRWPCSKPIFIYYCTRWIIVKSSRTEIDDSIGFGSLVLHIYSKYRGTVAEWLEHSSLVLKALSSKRSLWMGFFKNSLHSPSSKWVLGSLQSCERRWGRRVAPPPQLHLCLLQAGSSTATSLTTIRAMGQSLPLP